jgi:hypothetical protein
MRLSGAWVHYPLLLLVLCVNAGRQAFFAGQYSKRLSGYSVAKVRQFVIEGL